MLTPPTTTELQTFTGRTGYSSFVTQALAQSTLLFEVLTGLTEYPADASLLQLAKNGILEFADFAYNSQPYQTQKANPMQSETIGAYSYSKAIQAAKKGIETGIFWFDLAVRKLKTKDASEVGFGSISMDEWDHIISEDGYYKFVGPEEERKYSQILDPDEIPYYVDPWP